MSNSNKLCTSTSTAEGGTPKAEEFSTPILPPADTSSSGGGLDTFSMTAGDDGDFIGSGDKNSSTPTKPIFPFPNLACPATPKGNFSFLPLGVHEQLQQLNISGDDESAAAPSERILPSAAVPSERILPFKLKSIQSSVPGLRVPNISLNPRIENNETSFRSIDSTTLSPIVEDSVGWILTSPTSVCSQATRVGSPYLLPRRSSLFEEDNEARTM